MLRRISTIIGAAFAMVLASPLLAMAQTASTAATGGHSDALRLGLFALASNIGVGVAAAGCGVGQGLVGARAMESIGRNPNSWSRMFIPLILCFAFIESLTLYVLVLSFLIYVKI